MPVFFTKWLKKTGRNLNRGAHFRWRAVSVLQAKAGLNISCPATESWLNNNKSIVQPKVRNYLIDSQLRIKCNVRCTLCAVDSHGSVHTSRWDHCIWEKGHQVIAEAQMSTTDLSVYGRVLDAHYECKQRSLQYLKIFVIILLIIFC